MTDSIGAVELLMVEMGGYSMRDRALSLQGYFASRVLWNQLNEMFALSKQAIINQLMGGRYIYNDLTEAERNVQYCLFDSDRALNGFYVLRGFGFSATQMPTHYPWRATLFFIGTNSIRQRGYAFLNMEDKANDWE